MAARYKILEELGAGGAGAVYKAYDTQLDRYVAIKRLMTKEESEKVDAQTGSLKKEAGSLATLQHPNIVAVFDLGSDDEGFFMVMEMVEGETLAEWVRTTPMSLPDFQELAMQSMEAVMTAHSQNILHRDLKPENIKIKRLPGGRIQVKVLDFGLARMSYGAKKMTEDQKGNIIGSIYYMAPEQFLRKPVDVRTDLYSLGCVFYQALSRRRPYDGETVKDVMDAHLKHLVYPLKSIAPEVPQPISDWIMWLINAEPDHRPPNFEAAHVSLREIISAGWFNETITSAVPVVIPDEERGGWPTTSSVPRVPTSSQVRTASGAVSQRITSSVPARPVGAASQRMVPGKRVPTGAAPRAAVRHSGAVAVRAPAESEKKGIPVWVWPVAAVVVLGGAAAFIWPSKTAPAPVSTAPAAPTLPQRTADFFVKGAVVHYLAGEKMEGWSERGAPTVPATPNNPVKRWHDLAAPGGDNLLGLTNEALVSCPQLVFEHPPDLKGAVRLLRFQPGHGMRQYLGPGDSQLKAFPFFPESAAKGITILMLVRPRLEQLSGVRLLRMISPDGNTSLSLRAYANNDWKLAVAIGSQTKEVIVKGRDVNRFNLVGATWSAAGNKIVLNVRTADGTKLRAEQPGPTGTPSVMSELRISESSLGNTPTTTSAQEERFAGDIVELIYWPYAMEWEERSGQEWKLMQHYFANPGSRY